MEHEIITYSASIVIHVLLYYFPFKIDLVHERSFVIVDLFVGLLKLSWNIYLCYQCLYLEHISYIILSMILLFPNYFVYL